VEEKSKAAGLVLDGDSEGEVRLSLRAQVEYWFPIFEGPVSRVCRWWRIRVQMRRYGLATFITPDEIKRVRSPRGTAAGSDGIDAGDWLRVSCNVKALIFNLMLATRRSPAELLCSRTVLIPKKRGTMDPAKLGLCLSVLW